MCFTNVNEAGKRYRYFMYSTIKKKKKKKKLDWIFVAWPNRNKKSTGRHVALRVLGHIILTLNLCFYS